jgi:hypothetical protein
MMELDHFMVRLKASAPRIRAVIERVSDEQVRWKPPPDSWSILEVICHLRDEQREDFRVFLDFTRHRPGEPRPRIAPQKWVTERKHKEQELGLALQESLTARLSSLDWHQGLTSPDGEVTYEAPWGKTRAGDIFAARAAHDILHLRPLVRLHWAYTMARVEPYKVDYAGDWYKRTAAATHAPRHSVLRGGPGYGSIPYMANCNRPPCFPQVAMWCLTVAVRPPLHTLA